MLTPKFSAAVASAALLFGAAGAHADVVFSGTSTSSDGAPISATVDFSLPTPTLLQVVITSNDPAISQASVLTNLAFNAVPPAVPPLPNPLGTATPSSIVSGPGAPAPTTTAGQEWAYLTGGAASSGFGVGSGSGNLCGTAGCGVMLDGSSFGLVGVGTDLSLDGLATRTYIEPTITIQVPIGAGFSLSDITSVTFQYGTGPGEGSITGIPSGPPLVPEPATLALLGTALAAFGFSYRRRKSN